MSTSETTRYHASHFGYEALASDAKQEKVRGVFDAVAARYDVMNDMMSGGLHHQWKDRLMDTLRPTPDMRLLDMAGGTGDVAFRFLQRGGGHVTISDINAAMLEEGKARAIDHAKDATRMDWQQANAEELPFENAQFDAYTISFGIRNVTHLDKTLSEAYRVLKHGGRFLCLEFSMPDHAVLQKVYDRYSFNVIPLIGERITGDRAAYQYLVESIRQFPSKDAFAALITQAGFEQVTFRAMTQGVVTIHSGWKL